MKTRSLYFLLFFSFVIMVSSLAVVSARVIQPDGRINQIAHFGGDAFYCIGGDNQPTNQLGENGFLLLDMSGQPLWRIEAVAVEQAVATAQSQGGTVLVAEGQGTYGPAQLYVQLLSSGEVEFYFFANDEYFKQNMLIFSSCQPQETADDPDSSEVPVVEPTPQGTAEVEMSA